MPHDNGQLLTNEAIFKDRAYKDKRPGTVRWLEDGSGFTTLETVAEFKDAKLELDELVEPVEPELSSSIPEGESIVGMPRVGLRLSCAGDIS